MTAARREPSQDAAPSGGRRRSAASPAASHLWRCSMNSAGLAVASCSCGWTYHAALKEHARVAWFRHARNADYPATPSK